MLILLQVETPPPLPWWLLYGVLLAVTYGTYRLTRVAWWGGCMTALMGWLVLVVTAVLTIPTSNAAPIVLLPFIPAVAWAVGLRRHHRDVSPRAELAARLPARVARQIAPGVMQGQPSARAVQRSKVMEDRFAAGMPREAAFIARLRYVSGVGEMTPRPVDLFVGGAMLWVAPLTREPPPAPIPLRDVLRVDVWPELEGPPTLRVNWSPPAAEGTRDLVLAAMPNVPGQLVQPQLEAVAGMLTGLMHAEVKAAELAADVRGAPEPPHAEACPRCGETVPPGAGACPRCALPVPSPGRR
ncbi:MAG TPA: zinc ribbon domain-containing protein [Longimicrobium sp.]|jgi:hypothetical protein